MAKQFKLTVETRESGIRQDLRSLRKDLKDKYLELVNSNSKFINDNKSFKNRENIIKANNYYKDLINNLK